MRVAAGAVGQGRAEPPLRRRRHQTWTSRASSRPADPPGRARHDRLPRHQRSHAFTGACASRSSRPATSCARSARRSRPARSTTAIATRLRDAGAARLRSARHGRGAGRCPHALEDAFATAAANADVVITSGGVSVGEADYVKQLLDKLGEVLFWKIAMKPGRPLAYGKIGGAHFFGLPGNPVAVMVTFYQFVREALLVLQGRSEIAPLPTFKATLAAPIKKMAGRTEFQRGILRARATAAGKCARPANRARAFSPRCRRPTASSCSPPTPAMCAAGASGRRAAAGRLDLAHVRGPIIAAGLPQTPRPTDGPAIQALLFEVSSTRQGGI